ncbi:MAG: phosphoglucosamine mutase [Planctomycetaceae bacterium]
MAEPLIVSVSGLRGVVGESLTPPVAARYARAFVDSLPPGPVVVGRDGREHGPLFVAAIEQTLRAVGRDVLDCGVAATPTVGIVVAAERAAGGIQVSASHNPARYNGMKLFSNAGRVLTAGAGATVRAAFEADAARSPARGMPEGALRHVDGTAGHVARVLACVDVAAIRRRAPRVWIDCCHGAGSRVALPLLAALGCTTIVEGGEPDGRFAHPPEPVAANLAGLLPRIPAAAADVGFILDPDADRLAIADASGRWLGEEATLAIAADTVLRRTPGPVVVNCSTSGMTAQLATRHGVPCRMTAVGEANVVEGMLAAGAVIGGEGNGGVIDPRVVLVRDAAIAMALVLERLAAPTTMAELAATLPALAMVKDTVALPAGGLPAIEPRLVAAFPTARVARDDGLRLAWDGGWLLVRASNTEPIVRLVAEATGRTEVEAAIERARRAIVG